MAVEAPPKHEAAAGHAADQHLGKRRRTLNERLERWAMLFVGGVGAAIVGGALIASVPVIGIPLAVAGTIAEGVGFFGMVGNMLKRINKKNR